MYYICAKIGQQQLLFFLSFEISHSAVENLYFYSIVFSPFLLNCFQLIWKNLGKTFLNFLYSNKKYKKHSEYVEYCVMTEHKNI